MSPSYIIVAQSGRALAHSARQLGLKVYVLDLFSDLDTQQYAHNVFNVRSDSGSLCRFAVIKAIKAICQRKEIAGVIVGSGFEGTPTLLDEISKITKLVGNTPNCIQSICNSFKFFSALRELSIPFPEIDYKPRDDNGIYLLKRNGASGGGHISWYRNGSFIPNGYYLQRYIAGKTYSVVFIAEGSTASIIGFNRIYQTHTQQASPFTYAGGVALGMKCQLISPIASAVQAITRHFKLKGLCGMDFIIDENHQWYCLEINPRPPATYELHETAGELLAIHLNVCHGQNTSLKVPYRNLFKAHRYLYAENHTPIKKINWPAFVADQPQLDQCIAQGQPICTVFGEGSTPAKALRATLQNCISIRNAGFI